MDIVLEGPDNAGKSTLAALLARHLNRKVVVSEGREKSPGEINERVRRYAATYSEVIYDRHPVISQTLYSLIVPNTPVEEELVKEFYDSRPLIIYCRARADVGMEGHQKKDHDTEEYLEEIDTKYSELSTAYDEWALQKADLVYRIGDDEAKLLSVLKGLKNV